MKFMIRRCNEGDDECRDSWWWKIYIHARVLGRVRKKMHQHRHSCYYSWQLSMIIAFASCHNSIPLALTYVVCISATQLVFHSFMTKLYCISRWEIIIKSSEKSYLSRNPALWCDYKNEYEKRMLSRQFHENMYNFRTRFRFFVLLFLCRHVGWLTATQQQHHRA